ncbi:putative lipoprotein [Treponema primitia ZAS-2]|uniref:Putative lipoprotein n=1 Tax=Treponema primitia (strain ATCC BAA-887 / DSM 12427 / ZAS-2) TaxID=545694 RepID=F5YMT6_TREPZ|nr:hypothetical protein [Treponema primitia]AEF84956.1 putative lipoprotein [Treponema primitia ZAS-2]
MILKKFPVSSVFLWLLIMAGCATTIPVEVTRLPTLDTGGIERLAVEPFDPGETGAAQIARDLTNLINEAVLATKVFTLVSWEEFSRVRNSAGSYAGSSAGSYAGSSAGSYAGSSGGSIANFADAVISGELTRYEAAVNTRQDERVNARGLSYKVTQYKQELTLSYVFRLTRTRDGSVIGQISREGSDEGVWEDSRNKVPHERDVARSIIADLTKTLGKDIAPWKEKENRTLEKDKARDPRMKEANSQAKARHYRSAFTIYKEVYQDSGNFAAGFNAAILAEALGNHGEALELMGRLVKETGNPRAGTELERMKRTLAEAREAEEKFNSPLVGGPTTNAIRKVLEALQTQLPWNSTIAVLNTDSADQQLSDYIVEELSAGLARTVGLTMADRGKLSLRRAEHPGELSDEAAISIGRMLGCRIVITCALVGSGNQRRLLVKTFVVETGALTYQASEEI